LPAKVATVQPPSPPVVAPPAAPAPANPPEAMTPPAKAPPPPSALRVAPRLITPAPAPAFPVVAAAAPVAAAPVVPKQPGKPMSSGAKIGLVVGVVVVALAAGAFYFLRLRDRAPSAGVIQAAIEKQIANPLFKVTGVTPTVTQPDSNSADIQYKGVAELREPLYEQVESGPVLRDDLKLDVDAWQKAQQTVSGKDGARILELAGLKGVDDALLQTKFLKQVSAQGLKVPFEGRLHATKTGNDWKLVSPDGSPTLAPPTGQARATFGGHTAVVSDQTEMGKLREMAKAQAGVPDKIEQGRVALVEERRANAQKATAQLLGELAPGTLFAGTASTGSGTPDRLYLEITALQADDKRVTALLRNDGGWSDARGFQGAYAFDPESGALTVTLVTLRNQVVKKAGPFLERNESWQIVFSFNDGKLAGHSGEWSYDFTRLDASAAAAKKAELAGEAGLLQAATVPGKVFRGTARAKVGSDSYDYLLRFNRQEDNGNVIGATLEPPGRSGWQRAFHGNIIDSRSRAEGWPLRLETRSGDAVKAATGNALLTVREEYALKFKLVDGRLIGESADFNWDFASVTEAEIAKADADEAEAKRQIFALVKSGASFTGRASSASGETPERVRVRFTLVDQRNNAVEALVESLETSGVSREFRGPLDLVDGRLVLTPNSRIRGRPGKAVHFPAFVDASSDLALTFGVAGETLSGELKDSDWKLEF
jgi:hypothetical protein